MKPQKNTPFITIGITCYTEGDWLLDCWESILVQTDSRWEAVLVMDGGGDQRTKEIFNRLSHPKLRKYAFQENVGPYTARNKAFELTQTPFHFYVDGDDKLPNYAIEVVKDTIKKQTNVDVIYGDVLYIGTRSDIREVPRKLTIDDVIDNRRPVGASIYRKTLWKRLGGFGDNDILSFGMADLDFFIGAFETDAIFLHCGEIIYHRRVSAKSQVSNSYSQIVFKKAEKIVERHPQVFQDENMKRKFLAKRYSTSANYHFHHLKDYPKALELAKIAANYGHSKVYKRIQGNWRYRVPRFLIPLGDMIASRLNN